MLVVPGHLFGGVLISSPELDLRRYLWTPAIKWPACALVKLWLQPKQKKKAIYYQHELHKWFHSQNYTTLSNILFKNGTQIFLWFTVWLTYLVNPSREASAFSLSETTKLSQSHRHWYTHADRARLRFLMVNTVFMWLPIPGGRVISITVWRRSWVIHWMCLMGSATTVLELAMLADNRGSVVGKGKGDNSCCWGFSCWCSYNWDLSQSKYTFWTKEQMTSRTILILLYYHIHCILNQWYKIFTCIMYMCSYKTYKFAKIQFEKFWQSELN